MSVLHEVMQRGWTAPTAPVETPQSLRAAHPDMPAAFTVRMATALDIARVDAAKDKLGLIKAMVDSIASADAGGATDALRAALGTDGSTPESYGRQVEFLLLCVVEPALDRESVLWLGRHFPMFFSALFGAIMRLTGDQAQLGESPGSGIAPS